jgi:tetratricopeptide (TPR) repeat protein
MLSKLLPQFYEALRLPDAGSRKQRLLSKAVESLIQTKEFRPALDALESMAERDYGREALCLKGMREYARAAERYLQAGNPKEALACYREVPDFDAAFRLIQELKDHPAAESLRWLQRLQKVIDDRPTSFTRVMTASEKQLLEKLLEQALGVSRKKPATRQAAAVDANAKRKVEQYIREHSSSRYCDACLSEVLRLPKAPVAKAAREVRAGSSNVERLRATCVRCGEKKTCTGISYF